MSRYLFSITKPTCVDGVVFLSHVQTDFAAHSGVFSVVCFSMDHLVLVIGAQTLNTLETQSTIQTANYCLDYLV